MNLLCVAENENDQLRITKTLLYKKQIKDNAFKKNNKKNNKKNTYACK